jgi:large subunit ribosomal protein L15
VDHQWLIVDTGKRILSLHTSSSLLASPAIPQSLPTPDQYGRYPYEHPLLESLPNLSDGAKSAILSKNRLAQLGKDYGLQGVLRWQPKNVENLSGSGLELVMAQAVYAIVGAVALERGGVVASRVVRESVLKPFGLEGTEI